MTQPPANPTTATDASSSSSEPTSPSPFNFPITFLHPPSSSRHHKKLIHTFRSFPILTPTNCHLNRDSEDKGNILRPSINEEICYLCKEYYHSDNSQPLIKEDYSHIKEDHNHYMNSNPWPAIKEYDSCVYTHDHQYNRRNHTIPLTKEEIGYTCKEDHENRKNNKEDKSNSSFKDDLTNICCHQRNLTKYYKDLTDCNEIDKKCNPIYRNEINWSKLN